MHHPLALETGLTERESNGCARANARALASTRRRRDQPAGRPISSSSASVSRPTTDGDPARHRSRAVRRRQRQPLACSRSARSVRARASTCWSRRWRRSPTGRGAWSSRAIASAIRRRRRASTPLIARHRLRRTDRRSSARSRRASSRRSMPRPTCSCWPRASRAMAWPSPRRSRMACPSIGTTGGATPHTVPASAGRLVAPGDIAALPRLARADRRRRSSPRTGRRRARGGGAAAVVGRFGARFQRSC